MAELLKDDTEAPDQPQGGRRGVRPELRAMEELARIMDEFKDPRARRRIMDWLQDLYGERIEMLDRVKADDADAEDENDWGT